MTDAKPWEELVELVPELRPVLLGKLELHNYVSAWAWTRKGDTVPLDEQHWVAHETAHALIRDRAVQFIVGHGWKLDQGAEKFYIESIGELKRIGHADYDTALRLAVAAVAGKE